MLSDDEDIAAIEKEMKKGLQRQARRLYRHEKFLRKKPLRCSRMMMYKLDLIKRS